MSNIYPNQHVRLLVGSQHLYGHETLQQVDRDASEIVSGLNQDGQRPSEIRAQPVLTTPQAILHAIQESECDPQCLGVICWMHTFSPAKMWIAGLQALRKPMLHLHTQTHRDIPWSSIDMDFMNLHQSAHGGREFGHICTRLNVRRKVVVGHWQDASVLSQIDSWIRAAAAVHDGRQLRVARLGDNMRQVAVTDGDKVEAQIVFGYEVHGYGIGDAVQHVDAVKEDNVDELCQAYAIDHILDPQLRPGSPRHNDLREAARIELGLRSFLNEVNAHAFTDTFEDLHGLQQLPGIAAQRLMADGYGFGAEGDWKHAALVRAVKVMTRGLPGGTSFMEDYTYHFDPQCPAVLGAHMLEICPSIADSKPHAEIHPLGIGGKKDPVRLVFNAITGPAINASVIDKGDSSRLLINPVTAIEPKHDLPKLPVARVLWQPHPDLPTAAAEWIQAGGAHHTAYSNSVTQEMLEDYARILGLDIQLIA
ncbi:L-arabinose isomerase [Mucisphaera calidilacus]|uniref:L-arabinose isomerase n=1 Tax=Mucisphaera calidilacus TaxID=2527982 RepID=A0A518C0A3_9BACT|nr:L-arabinose isomerase [Mucisphaera calidilacus]QDU72649.1 L-arabinose isomerase [Mucisphaera calidilacus]